MIVTIFYDNSRLVVYLSESTCNQTNDSMFEIRRIIEDHGFTRIDILESFLKMDLSSSFSSFIQVFELSEKLIRSSFPSEEPTECCQGSIHTTGCIDPRSDLETDYIGISLDLLSTFEKIPESNRF